MRSTGKGKVYILSMKTHENTLYQSILYNNSCSISICKRHDTVCCFQVIHDYAMIKIEK